MDLYSVEVYTALEKRLETCQRKMRSRIVMDRDVYWRGISRASPYDQGDGE